MHLELIAILRSVIRFPIFKTEKTDRQVVVVWMYIKKQQLDNKIPIYLLFIYFVWAKHNVISFLFFFF